MSKGTGIIGIMLCTLFLFCNCRSESESQSDKSADEVVLSTEPARSVPDIASEFLVGKFQPETDEDFIEIDTQYADEAGMYMQREAYKAFVEMFEAAKEDGVHLEIRSAARNFYRQQQIWEAKWTGARLVDNNENLAESTPDPKERALKILRWSSMPGTSRHHWGTDIDLNAFENDYFKSGTGLQVYQWLTAHAPEYGFCQPYTEKGPERPHGYNEERWHWSYKPLAEKFLAAAKSELDNEDIEGFLGSETATQIDVKQKYILGVSNLCK